MEEIKTDFGAIKHFKTKEAGFNIETMNPEKSFRCYLKKSNGIIIIQNKIKLLPSGNRQLLLQLSFCSVS